MNVKPWIGMLIPEFPGQTHAFFWREIRALEARGVAVAIFSTRPPPPGIVAHAWSAEAIARTTYLGRPRLQDVATALAVLRLGDFAQDGPAAWRDLALCLPAAQMLIQQARARGISHIHVHSCGRAALVAALAQRSGGPSYSLTLHNTLSVYGLGQTSNGGGPVSPPSSTRGF